MNCEHPKLRYQLPVSKRVFISLAQIPGGTEHFSWCLLLVGLTTGVLFTKHEAAVFIFVVLTLGRRGSFFLTYTFFCLVALSGSVCKDHQSNTALMHFSSMDCR